MEMSRKIRKRGGEEKFCRRRTKLKWGRKNGEGEEKKLKGEEKNVKEKKKNGGEEK